MRISIEAVENGYIVSVNAGNYPNTAKEYVFSYENFGYMINLISVVHDNLQKEKKDVAR